VILPTKRLPQDRTLLFIGAQVLELLGTPTTVSRAWDQLKTKRDPVLGYRNISYDWFVLALCFLFTCGVVELSRGRLRRTG